MWGSGLICHRRHRISGLEPIGPFGSFGIEGPEVRITRNQTLVTLPAAAGKPG